jgi:hypothetical protein
MSILLAVRHWELQAFAELRRRKPQRLLGTSARIGR